jgi:Bacterial protein of unknown function (DUF916)
MRFLLSLIAGLVLVGLAPVAGAEAAAQAHSASAMAVSGTPAKAEFGAGPASAKKLDGRPYFTYDATPGGYVLDHIAVVNFATRPQTLNVYPVDAVTGKNGLFAYATRSAPRKQVGAWLSVGKVQSGTVTVKPRSTVILPFYLRVPRNASPGDHAGAVIVSLTGLVKSKKKNTLVKFEQRIATRVIVRVSGPLHPRLSIQNLHGSFSGHLNPFASGVVHLSYTVGNTGNALLGGTQHVSGHGLFGSTGRATTVPSVPLLLPGGAYKVTTHVSDVFPEIEITETVKLAPVGLRGDLNPGLQVATASVTLWVIPWPLIAVVIIILLVTIALIWRRRRRSPKSGGTTVSKTPQGAKA